MQSEIDIVDLVTNLRMSRFVSQMNLNNYQRYFVNKFSMYNIDVDEAVNGVSIYR
jgi:hypothetical protein